MEKVKISEVMRIFTKSTERTYPAPYDKDFPIGEYIEGLEKDEYGNYVLRIGDSKTAFTCHLDTADSTPKKVYHVIKDNKVYTDGSSILGADDKAGFTIMYFMIKNKVPGIYLFFLEEEVGMKGSEYFVKNEISKYDIQRVISFDRRDYGSVITYQLGSRCCSDKFADELSRQLEFGKLTFFKDSGGIYTDSYKFIEYVPECTNISVGYFNAHTCGEYQDIEYLTFICNRVLSVDWENLPSERNPSEKEDLFMQRYNSFYDEKGRRRTVDFLKEEDFLEDEDDIFSELEVYRYVDNNYKIDDDTLDRSIFKILEEEKLEGFENI